MKRTKVEWSGAFDATFVLMGGISTFFDTLQFMSTRFSVFQGTTHIHALFSGLVLQLLKLGTVADAGHFAYF